MNGKNGLTLIEVMMATSIMGIVSMGAVSVNLSSLKLWNETGAHVTASLKNSAVMTRIVDGSGNLPGLRSASNVQVVANGSAWELMFDVPGVDQISRYRLRFTPGRGVIEVCEDGDQSWVTVARDIAAAAVTVADGTIHISTVMTGSQGRAAVRNTMETEVRIRNA